MEAGKRARIFAAWREVWVRFALPPLARRDAARQMRGVLTLYHLLVIFILVLLLANVVANLVFFDGLRRVAAPEGGPLVSVLVPARDEALNIEENVRSLLLQDYPRYELIVLDDHSTDGTGAIVERLMAQVRNPRVTARIIEGAELPEGWTGKNWACHQLYEAASGEFLLFTDADTTHAPGTVSAAVDYACRKNAALVSAWPRMIMKTPGEKLVQPMIVVMGMAFAPLWLLRLHQAGRARLGQRQARRFGAANGQFMLFTRDAYERIGGHAAVRDHVVEDVTLGREVAARAPEGLRLFNCDALRFSTVRMYRSFAEVWEGFTKNMRAVFDQDRAGFWLFGVVQVLCFLLPCIMIFTAPAEVWRMVAVEVGLIYALRLLLLVRFRSSLFGALLHPLGVLLLLLIGLNSWRRSIGGGVVWKGRTYKPRL